MKPVIVITFLLVLFSSRFVQAGILANGSFESGAFVPNSDNTMSLLNGATTMTGWTVIGDSIAWIGTPNPFSFNPSEGSFFLDLTDYPVGSPYGGVRQAISTIPFAVYTISFDVGAAYGVSKVQVSAGDLSDIGIASSSGAATWTKYTSFFSAQSALTTIDLLGIEGSVGGSYIGLDNVVVELHQLPNAVPEPCMFLIGTAFGLGGLIAKRRMKK
jgi:hypothetical protein